MGSLIEREVRITTAHGVMPAYAFYPDRAEPLPAVLMFMDAPGIRDELFDAARRIARAGFYCLLPDLYYRIGLIRIDLTRRTDAHAEVYRALGGGLTNAQARVDTANALGFLAGEAVVREGPVGCLGFSIGGRFAVQAAGLFPSQIAAVAAICGTGIATDSEDSPHLSLPGTRAAFTLEFADHDPAVSENVIPELRRALEAAAADHEITAIEGTQHGYVFPIRPMYDPIAAEQSWARVLALFAKRLA